MSGSAPDGLVRAEHFGVFLYIEPLITLIIVALVLSEKMTIEALILLGVWLVNRP